MSLTGFSQLTVPDVREQSLAQEQHHVINMNGDHPGRKVSFKDEQVQCCLMSWDRYPEDINLAMLPGLLSQLSREYDPHC